MARNTKTCAPERYLTTEKAGAIDLIALTKDAYPAWLQAQSAQVQDWLKLTEFKALEGNFALCQKDPSTLAVLVIVGDDAFTSLAQVRSKLPAKVYHVQFPENLDWKLAVIGWVLDAYEFTKYKDVEAKPVAKLMVDDVLFEKITRGADAHYLVRDLINTPAEDMGPSELSAQVAKVANEMSAEFSEIKGEALLKENYPAIHAVGRASDDEPRILHLSWGDTGHPTIALVGKGVCFDTGGLDIKGAESMRWMKKDMGGAAHVLGLAQWIMSAGLKVRLELFISAVENNVSANAYRPGDVVDTRKGLTVEIGNTDAEGRVVLSDALVRACEHQPELVIDFATLTGAARVALGAELPAIFCDDDAFVSELSAAGEQFADQVWRLPLHKPYKKHLASSIADLNNMSNVPFGGAITAALFLHHFVEPDITWCHVDLMAFNAVSRPARPEGGEAMGLRAFFALLEKRYG